MGKAPVKGSEEHDAVLARMGKPTKAYSRDMKKQAAVNKKGEVSEAKHQKSIAAASKKAEKEEAKHQKAMAAASKKAIADLMKRAKKGELSSAQMKAFHSILNI